MTIGIIILSAAILLIFFGVAERFFQRLGIANWLAFLLVLALVVGAVVPNIQIGSRFSMNVSGFLIPIAIMLLFEVLIGWSWELARAILAQISVAATTIVVRMLMPNNTAMMVVTTSLIVGFLGGAVAYITGQTRMSVIVGTMGGIVLGDITTSLIHRYAYGAMGISLGTGGVFNSIIIALVFGLLLLESINAMLRATNRRRIQTGALSFEAGEDFDSKQYKKKKAEEQMKQEFSSYDDYFDDKIL